MAKVAKAQQKNQPKIAPEEQADSPKKVAKKK